MLFTNQLFEGSKDIWEEYIKHPFVKKLGDGTLEKDKFKYYMIQDYLYLIEYTKVFCMGAVKSRDVSEINMFYNGADGILNDETATHINYLKNFGVPMESIEKYHCNQTTDSYTSYMKSIALTGDIYEIVAVLLPCVWSYNYIGENIKNIETKDNFYQSWINCYSSEEYKDFTNEWINFTNKICEPLSKEEKEKLVKIFRKASIYEMDFWNMAEEGEKY